MADELLCGRLVEYLKKIEVMDPRRPGQWGTIYTGLEALAAFMVHFIREEIDDAVKVERFRHTQQALPDRWLSLRRVDFIGFIELYRERREVHNEDHDDALDHLLAEVDFEPNQDDLFDRRNRLD